MDSGFRGMFRHEPNAKCLDCNMVWVEPIRIINKCPNCSSNKIVINKLSELERGKKS